MALCLHLAFWTGGDVARMDRLFRQSGLMREKWDEVHYADGATYGERAIERALETVDEVYEPDRDSANRLPPLSEMARSSRSDDHEPPAPSDRGGESVYLEERNRLLRQQIQSQAATIERQANRIEELERELDAVRTKLAARARTSEGDADESSRWNWLATRLGYS